MVKKPFTTRLDEEIFALAQKLADAERRSITGLIEVAILEYAKPVAPAVAAADPDDGGVPAKEGKAATKGLIIRLNPAAWKQIKQLALDQEVSIHALLIEGVNHIFEKNGKGRIA